MPPRNADKAKCSQLSAMHSTGVECAAAHFGVRVVEVLEPQTSVISPSAEESALRTQVFANPTLR